MVSDSRILSLHSFLCSSSSSFNPRSILDSFLASSDIQLLCRLAADQRVLERLPTKRNCEELRDVFASSQGEGFVALVKPFQKLVNYEIMAKELYAAGFLPVLLDRVKHHDALVCRQIRNSGN